MSFNSLVSKP